MRGELHVGYLVESLPTFITREIEELRRQGVPLTLYSVFALPPGARFADEIVFPTATQALASGARALIESPAGFARALAAARALGSSAAKFFRSLYIARHARGQGVSQFHGTFAAWPAEQAAIAAAYLRVPFSFTGHAYDLFMDNPNLAEKLARAGAARMISEYNTREIGRRFPTVAAKLHTIHLGVPRAKQAAPEGPLEILSVGRLVAKKGFDDLIRALARLEQGPPLRIVGEGPERARLQELIDELNPGSRVTLAGALPNDQVRRMLEGNVIVALACRDGASGDVDGIPVALMEAMAAGKPVVSTRISGIPELVRDARTGVLVEPRDVPALAEALERLIADPALRRSLGEAAAAHVAREFDLATQTRRLIALFEQLETRVDAAAGER